MLKKMARFALLAALVIGAAAAEAGVPSKPLRNNGRWIVDDDGRVYIFHGVNMINKLPPYSVDSTGFSDDDAELLAKNGVNVVRVGVIYSAVEPSPGVYDEKYLKDSRKTVEMLAGHGIMSLIDFHQDGWGPSFICEGFPEWATMTAPYEIRPIPNFPELYLNKAVQTAFDNFWADRAGPGGMVLQDRYAAAWVVAAGKLKDAKGILGWELMNEPFPGSKWKDPDNQALTAFTQKMVNAIRTVDTEHIIWYEPWVTFDEGIPTFIGPINDPGPVRRIGFAFHNYLPVAKYDVVWQNALSHSAATGDALLATEFGASTKASEIQEEMTSVNSVMMPAIYWAYWNRTPYQIATPLGKDISSADQALVYDPTRPLVPGNVWEDKLTALTGPYPMSIAGTPTSWSFASDTKVFNFAYTSIPPGGTKAIEGVTEIFVPKRRYLYGFTVSVEGGLQLPSKNEQVVLVANKPGVQDITVQIVAKPRPAKK